MRRVLHVVGARPNFMKVAPIMKEMRAHGGYVQFLLHTGQHYGEAMSDGFFTDLDLPLPDINLGIGSGSHAWQTAQIMLKCEPVLLGFRPDWVIVVGDVNSTLACALVSAKLGARVAHIEAGLRSFDRSMPEEVNRVAIDHLSDLLFTPSDDATSNLLREGIPPSRIRAVGNVMIDSLRQALPKAERRPVLRELGLVVGGRGRVRPFVLATLHRPTNVDCRQTFTELWDILAEISRDLAPVVFPVHPRVGKSMRKWRLSVPNGNFLLVQPLGYLDFLALEKHAAAVVTDSGGVQEETTYLRIPCLTVRPNSERPITVKQGTNTLVTRPNRNLKTLLRALLRGVRKDPPPRPLPRMWDGHSASRIVKAISEAPPSP